MPIVNVPQRLSRSVEVDTRTFYLQSEVSVSNGTGSLLSVWSVDYSALRSIADLGAERSIFDATSQLDVRFICPRRGPTQL